jgi:peptide/nickel transport system permease protein
MVKLLARRLLSVIPVIFVVSLVAFLLVSLAPGDPATTLAGENASPEVVAAVRTRLGLDKPPLQRLIDFEVRILHADLGTSFQTSQPVAEAMRQTLPVTGSLSLIAIILAILMGAAAGIVSALRRGGLTDRLINAVSAIGVAVPPFVLAFVLIIPLAVLWHLFPATGYVGITDDPLDWLRHLILPGFALAIPSAAELGRQLRGSLVDTLEQDFIRTGRACGLLPLSLIGKHALKNSAIPVVTVLGLQASRILGGAVVVESVFAIPGFGTLSFAAVLQHDVPVIQGVVLVSAAIVLAINLLVDLSYGYFNPRLRS